MDVRWTAPDLNSTDLYDIPWIVLSAHAIDVFRHSNDTICFELFCLAPAQNAFLEHEKL